MNTLSNQKNNSWGLDYEDSDLLIDETEKIHHIPIKVGIWENSSIEINFSKNKIKIILPCVNWKNNTGSYDEEKYIIKSPSEEIIKIIKYCIKNKTTIIPMIRKKNGIIEYDHLYLDDFIEDLF